MSYSARILADSVSPEGIRLTTFEATFPRFILAEVNTHRMLSRNSASSRAIPPEKLIYRVRENPFIPETFNKRVKGMGVGEAFSEREQDAARAVWENAAEYACRWGEQLAGLGVDKSRVNRVLEPFLWHTAIISATEWDNFWGLRDHPAAQPEFQIIAKMMRELYESSEPQELQYGWWHLPLVSEEELAYVCKMREHDDPVIVNEIIQRYKLVSASRCARVSFDKHTDTEDLADTTARAERLMNSVPAHLSPFEHVARPAEQGEGSLYRRVEDQFFGNFRGWVQMRKEIANEGNALRMIEAAVA